MYKDIYKIGLRISKRDRFGIQAKVESLCLEILTISIETAFKAKNNKEESLKLLRIKIEVLKHLIRLYKELKIIEEKTYIRIQNKLQEISKMAAGWLKYFTQKGASK